MPPSCCFRQDTPVANNVKCFHCGTGNHKPTECYIKDTTCNKCNKRGHIARICRSRPQVLPTKRNPLQVNVMPMETPIFEENEEYSLFIVYNTKDNTKPLVVSMILNEKEIAMEINTGSAVTVLPEATYRSISTEPLHKSTIKLCTYSGEQLEVIGTAMCKVEYDGKTYRLPVVVLADNGPILLGRSWLYHIPLQWTKLFYSFLNISQAVANFLQKYQEVFSDKIGMYTGGKVDIQIDPKVMPKFCKPRPLPFTIKDKVEDEFKKLQEQDVIKLVKFSKRATPIVSVLKHDRKSIRICGDYRLTVNNAAHVDQ